VHWKAPEVLNESADVDLILADVYSFGITLWELLTREQPYMGLSPSAVAVSVIRDNLRPAMPDNAVGAWPVEFEELITCWHRDPTIRPTFLEIMTRLSAMHGDSTGGVGASPAPPRSPLPRPARRHRPVRAAACGRTPTARGLCHRQARRTARRVRRRMPPGTCRPAAAAGTVRAPEGEVTIVFTDITRAASFWEFNAATRDATLLHNEALRSALKPHRGYEVVFIRDRNSGEGSFCMAFQQAADALAWCADVQQALFAVNWPSRFSSTRAQLRSGATPTTGCCTRACTWAHPRWCVIR
jgi:hypothetical protein